MIYGHIIAAILASWRITELITQDRISQGIRQKVNSYLLSCPRCMSVWAGAFVTVMYALGPMTHDWTRWAMWPFALAWVYLVQVESRVARRMDHEGRRLTFEARGTQWTVVRNDFTPQELHEILSKSLASIVQQPVPPSTPVTTGRVNGGPISVGPGR